MVNTIKHVCGIKENSCNTFLSNPST